MMIDYAVRSSPCSGLSLCSYFRIWQLGLVFMILLGIFGCATTQIVGESATGADFSHVEPLAGQVDYSGNQEYLPRMLLKASQGNASNRQLVFRYAFDVSYDVPKEHDLTVFNPLLIVGMSKSTDTLVVRGFLDVIKQGNSLKHYESVIVLRKSKTLFSEGETLTDMRRRGLLLVRDQIDSQLLADRSTLSAYVDPE